MQVTSHDIEARGAKMVLKGLRVVLLPLIAVRPHYFGLRHDYMGHVRLLLRVGLTPATMYYAEPISLYSSLPVLCD
jgi:hypothetical protein